MPSIDRNGETEKIWDAIAGNCMPIYWANGTIDLNVPSELHVDARGTASFEELVHKI